MQTLGLLKYVQFRDEKEKMSAGLVSDHQNFWEDKKF